MIKEIETIKLLTSVVQNGKVVGLYFEHELPPLSYLYHKYGKASVHTNELKMKSFINVITDKELRRQLNNRLSIPT